MNILSDRLKIFKIANENKQDEMKCLYIYVEQYVIFSLNLINNSNSTQNQNNNNIVFLHLNFV